MIDKVKMSRQDSLTDQLITVKELANKAGCYDAADFIQKILDRDKTEENQHSSGFCQDKKCGCHTGVW